LKTLESYPDSAIARNITLELDGYDVVNKGEYPSLERLVKGAEGSYDAVMMTGSSTLRSL